MIAALTVSMEIILDKITSDSESADDLRYAQAVYSLQDILGVERDRLAKQGASCKISVKGQVLLPKR